MNVIEVNYCCFHMSSILVMARGGHVTLLMSMYKKYLDIYGLQYNMFASIFTCWWKGLENLRI